MQLRPQPTALQTASGGLRSANRLCLPAIGVIHVRPAWHRPGWHRVLRRLRKATSLVKLPGVCAAGPTVVSRLVHGSRVAALPQTAEAAVATAQAPQSEQPPAAVFSWTARWWPVQAIESLNPRIPEHVDLLGKSLVVWGDGQGQWHCLEDKCPHRLAPLSEGRVEQGQIMCCYHGWTFSGTGACTGIPQLAGDSKAHANTCGSKRACVAAYPTRVHNGLLWIWPESGEAAAQQAASQEPQGMPNKGFCSWYVRDIPVRYDTLIENTLDGAHVQFAHHGVQGNRYEKNSFWNVMTGGDLDVTGFAATSAVAKRLRAPMVVHFNPPFHAYYTLNDEHFGLQVAIVPTKPGWSRFISNFNMEPSFLPPMVKLLFKLRLGIPVLKHLNTNGVLDGDSYLLHAADRHLPVSKGVGIDAAAHSFYMPASSDLPCIALRKWLQQYGPAPTCAPADEAAIPPLMPKEQVLDRYQQHTQICSHCRNALATLDRVQGLSTVLGLAAAVAFVAQAIAASAVAHVAAPLAAATASSGPLALPGLLLLSGWQAVQAAGLQHALLASGVLAVLCLGLHTFLAKWRRKFIYEGYVHALRD